jgi:hypothetical protein
MLGLRFERGLGVDVTGAQQTMQQLPFDKPGRFYKGNLHVHSNESDGKLSPVEVIDNHKSRGYDFISLTDHLLPYERFNIDKPGTIPLTDTTGFRDETFTTLIGAEIHGPSLGNGDLWHLVAAGLPLDFPLWDGVESGPEIAARANAAGAFVGIAHPAWYALTLEDAMAVLEHSHSVEIYNHACAMIHRADGWYLADSLFDRGIKLSVYAADDAHFKHPQGTFHDAFGGWVQVKAESLSPESILAALKAGSFYSSTGAELRDIRIEGDELVVESSPAELILITSRGAQSANVYGENLTEARFPLKRWRDLGFARVTVIDAAGNRAWSNPIWFNDAN